MTFKNPEVNAKYKSLLEGDVDPIVHVVIGYDGPLSEVPLAIADKMFADGAQIDLKNAADKAATDRVSAKEAKASEKEKAHS